MKPSVLILFDIDSTLLQVQRGLSLKNFKRSFANAHDLEDVQVEKGYTFHGRTDKSIYRDVCLHNQINEGLAEERERAFVDELVGGWRELLSPDTIELLEGALESVEKAHDNPRLFLSLLTGNVEDGAAAKLAPHKLNRYFRSGGFGSDAVERNHLPAIALRRIEVETNHSFSPENSVIIGDSVRDIECARAGGMHAVAVATGGDSMDVLAKSRPDLLLESLADQESLFSFVNSICP